MTLYGLLAALAWCAVAVYAIREVRGIAERWLAVAHPEPEPNEASIALPDDIVAFAMSQSEEWAQEEVLKAARERYAKLRGTKTPDDQRWNVVRGAIGIGGMP